MSGFPVPNDENIFRRFIELIVKEDSEMIATDLYQKRELGVDILQCMHYLSYSSGWMMFPGKSPQVNFA